MYSQIPQGLQALMVLQNEAQPMGPAGPTVASQLMQRVQQPSMSPAPQIGQPQLTSQPRMMPGAPNQGQPGLMDTLQAQSQRSAQIPINPPQSVQPPGSPPGQRPQGMAHGGIASLRADNMARLKYAKGGVIGYSGEEESFVTPQRRADETFEEFRQRVIAEQEAVQQRRAAAKAAAAEADRIAEMQRRGMPLTSPFTQRPQTAAVYNPALEDARRREDIPPGGMVVATPGGAAPAPAPRPPASPRPATPAAATAQPAMENPDLVVARRLRDAQFTGTAPTIESTLAEQQKFRAAQGLTGPVGSAIEAAMKTHAERAAATEAAYRKGQEGQGLESLIAALSAGRRGVGALGEQYVKGQEAQRAAEMNFQQLMNASAEKREQMGITLQNLREAEANRDYTAYQKNLDEFRKQKHDFDTVQRQLAASTLQGSVQMQEGAANRASQEKIARIREANQLGQLDQRRQAMAIAAAKAVENDPLLKSIAPLAMGGDPVATKRYRDREAEIYMIVAPELMLGGSAPSASSALASATAIARGKQ